jgi:ribosomal protein S11
MLVALGIAAAIVLCIGVVVAIRMARTQTDDDEPPASRPGDFVAPVSSGGFRFRQPDETQEDFAARVARENAEKDAR